MDARRETLEGRLAWRKAKVNAVAASLLPNWEGRTAEAHYTKASLMRRPYSSSSNIGKLMVRRTHAQSNPTQIP